jgi:hypothetical protein
VEYLGSAMFVLLSGQLANTLTHWIKPSSPRFFFKALDESSGDSNSVRRRMDRSDGLRVARQHYWLAGSSRHTGRLDRCTDIRGSQTADRIIGHLGRQRQFQGSSSRDCQFFPA